MSEIHHRVNNNMQIISSLLKLQSGHIEGGESSEIFRESQNRIKSMALIHEKLYRSESLANIDLKEYIESVAQSLFRSYGTYSRNIDLKMEVESIRLGIDTAIPCGLIINELVSNSLKYAFPDGKPGEIRISLHSDDKNELELTVCDNGVGIPKELDIGNTKTLGLYLVSILIEDQLQGKIELSRTHGSEFRLYFREAKYKERI
ncbi:MAG: sensor histidine kinase [Desulfobacterales bacterium]|nr:sensor histidine kinase [Desulfobacterales bacterium]